MSIYAKWQFPPSNGGADFVQDPSSTHFSDAPIPKLVREVVQNSLDARDGSLAKPVIVKFTETSVERDLIGANELERHLKACRDRERSDESLRQRQTYVRASRAIKQKRIRCLQIVDSGTTGLKEANWDALVSQEGSVQKSGNAPGGSYGIGKNAVFNVSDLRTVFYSTRYLANRQGRVEKLQGKATLMTHANPNREDEKLQHIGFYRRTQTQQPILGTSIPDFFRLGEQGTGVYIMGFNPRSDDWVNEVTLAVIENFFYAIQHKRLAVEISAQGSEGVTITYETIEQMFVRRAPDSRSYHYYKAIRDEKPISTSRIGAIGSLEVFLTIGSGPRHIAHVNRNGMLITDSKAQRTNPLAPRGSSLWPDFAVVVVPASDDTDKWIRRMENPSHDSISTGQLFEPKERRDAERTFRNARQAIRKIIDEQVGVAQFGDVSNLQELAELFPDDLNPEVPGNIGLNVAHVPTRLVPPSPNRTHLPGFEVEPKPDPEPKPGPNPGPNPDPPPPPPPEPSPDPEPSPGDKEPKPPTLTNCRIIPVGQREAIVAFDLAKKQEPSRTVIIPLTPAGEQRSDASGQIEITEARILNAENQEVPLEGGMLSLSSDAAGRVLIRVATRNRIDNLALKIG